MARRKGSLNRKTRRIAEKAAKTGVTPLEVMIANMRYWHGLLADEPDSADARKQAQDAACDAAPYMHPRLSAVAATISKGETKDWSSVLAELREIFEDAVTADDADRADRSVSAGTNGSGEAEPGPSANGSTVALSE